MSGILIYVSDKILVPIAVSVLIGYIGKHLIFSKNDEAGNIYLKLCLLTGVLSALLFMNRKHSVFHMEYSSKWGSRL